MRRALVLAAALALAGCAGDSETVTEVRTVEATVTETVTETATDTSATDATLGIPAPVAETHAALLAAARSGDYEQLRPLIPDDFSYTFGGPVEGGPIAFWKQSETESGVSPIAVLAAILELPPTLFGGTYVWPFAFDKQADELTDYERELLGDLANDFAPGTGYLGWRAGIAPDGTWVFFIAGD